MSLSANPIDPGRCPLCGQPNACAMACTAAAAGHKPCWCVSATFSPELLQRIPVQAQGRACVCQNCAQSSANAA